MIKGLSSSFRGSKVLLYGFTSVSTIGLIASLDFVAPTKLYPPPNNKDEEETIKVEGFRTYWTDTCQEKAIIRPAHLPSSVSSSSSSSSSDVVIIGGGMAGLHTALSLAEAAAQQQQTTTTTTTQKTHQQTKKLNITILEASSIGSSFAGASGLSKGLVVPGIQVPYENLKQSYGQEIARNIYDLTYKAQSSLKERICKYNIKCRVEEGAGLVEASIHPPPPPPSATTTTESKDEDDDDDDDDDCEDLNATQLQRLLGTNPSLYKCGEHDKSCFGLDPLGLTRGLARACESLGVVIYEHTKAIEIQKTTEKEKEERHTKKKKKKFRVKTSNDSYIDCNHVVICSGAEHVSPKLSSYLNYSVVPIYTYMGVTEPMSEEDCPIPPIPYSSSSSSSSNATTTTSPSYIRPMGGDDYVCLNYWRCCPTTTTTTTTINEKNNNNKNEQQKQQYRILFGSLADSYPTPIWLAKKRLEKAFYQVYPQCRQNSVKFDCVWGGALAFGRRAIPLIGRDEHYENHNNNKEEEEEEETRGSVWYATGFGGHGIVPTAMAGSIVADAILGRDDNTWRMFHDNFPPQRMFWPVGRLGAQLVLCLYNAVDWLHVKGVPVPEIPKPW